ncbi:MAG: filamentous hemagglutinin N-terminal domain-containing protein [Parachlamydiales bacterium]|jgi:filamentous hemagglutinin family protein
MFIKRVFQFFFSGLLPCLLLSNPTGASLQSGQAVLSSEEKTLTVVQTSDKAVLHWEDFSIKAGEKVLFSLPSSNASTLNRVTGDKISKIYGQLKSNGALYLINPRGIVIGPSGWIDVAGFLVSTYDLSDSDYLLGSELNFTENPLSADISHRGFIYAPSGNIAFIAREIDNQGVLVSPQGRVSLNAGFEVYLLPEDRLHSFIRLKKAGRIKTSGTIQALEVEILASGGSAYALAIESGGLIDATGVESDGGSIVLFSPGKMAVSSHLSAQKSSERGGEIYLLGSEVFLNRGALLRTPANLSSGKIFIGGNYLSRYPALDEKTVFYQEAGAVLQTGSLEILKK